MRLKYTGVILALASALSLSVHAAPSNSGSVVINDKPISPDLVIQEVRVDNAEATHTPVKIRISAPADDGSVLKWGRVVAYTTATADPEGSRLTEREVQIGRQWANRSLTIQVPSPGAGDYFIQVIGEFRLGRRSDMLELRSISTKQIHFDDPSSCTKLEKIGLEGISQPCPLLFDTKSARTRSSNSKIDARNKQVLDIATAQIQELCAAGHLRRVSVRGWASTTHSTNPPNESLARDRASTVVSTLAARAPHCAARIRSDSVAGTRAVTSAFGSKPKDNQCVQIEIFTHECNNP